MTVINDFLSLIYPRHCEACGRIMRGHEHYICFHCRLNLPKSNYHTMAVSPMYMAFAGRVPLVMACSYYLYEKSGKVQRLLHAIKYEQQQDLAAFLGKQYAYDLSHTGVFDGIDVIMPIPLHEKKLKQRGYNQSECFASGLSSGLNKQVDTQHLQRIAETDTQTRKKKYERWENVEGIFAVKEPEALYGKHVLLVDDVVTTGATIESAWLALKEVPEVKVSVASIAFADKHSNY